MFEVITCGAANSEGFSDFYKAIIQHPDWTPGRLIFTDHSKLHAEHLPPESVKAIASLCYQYKESFGSAKIAILVDRDVEYGLARMWQMYINDGAWDVSQKLFKSKEDALLWLRE